jgi:hypothetical protein
MFSLPSGGNAQPVLMFRRALGHGAGNHADDATRPPREVFRNGDRH